MGVYCGLWHYDTTNAEKYIKVVGQHTWPSVFFKDVPAHYSKGMSSLILDVLPKRGFVVNECEYCTGLRKPQPRLSLIENVWRVINPKIRQLRPRTVEQLKL